LNFFNVPPPHSGVIIADALQKSFIEWGVENNVYNITNLLVQDGISQIEDIMDCVRNGIKYIVASEGRLKQFAEIAKQLQLSSKKLILDVPTG